MLRVIRKKERKKTKIVDKYVILVRIAKWPFEIDDVEDPVLTMDNCMVKMPRGWIQAGSLFDYKSDAEISVDKLVTRHHF